MPSIKEPRTARCALCGEAVSPSFAHCRACAEYPGRIPGICAQYDGPARLKFARCYACASADR